MYVYMTELQINT